MGYKKMVLSGNLLEIYAYENDCNNSGRKRKSDQNEELPDSGMLDGDRPDSLRGKRVREKKARRWDNARRAALVFRRLIRAQLGGTQTPVLVTCTYARNETSITTGYRDFRDFINATRRKFGLDFRYVAVPEFQKRGAIHFHALFWGLPDEILGSERRTRLVAGLWGHGFVYLKATDGNERLSTYLAKYMSKAFMAPELAGKKAYTASKN